MSERNPEQGRDERIVAEALVRLPVVKAPEAIWSSIEASLAQPSGAGTPLPALHKTRWHRLQPVWSSEARRSLWWRWILLPTAILLLFAVALHTDSLRRTRWQVLRTSGSGHARTETIRAGQWLQTDASSTAEVRVGMIGTVEVEPDTRLRVIATRPNENRLSLEHGEIAATISAPPKLFFVETKSATAVDLGCKYRMKVDAAGNGLLRVTLGWVSFEWQGRESLVPAGANCRTRAAAGPGTPFFEDAPARLTTALDDFDFSNGGEAALRAILAEARPRDTLTLWHLLRRVPDPLRPLVYDRMIAFAPPPAGVTREKALAVDPQTLKIWKDELAWTW